MRNILLCLLLVACKKTAPAVTEGSGSGSGSSGSGSGSGSAIAAVVVDAAPVPTPDAAEGSGSGSGSGSAAADDGVKSASDTFGGVALGLKKDKVIAMLGEPESKEPVEEEGATGLWVSAWKWPKKGVELQMAGANKTEAPTVNSFTLTPPATLKTDKGLGIGSTRAEILKVYGSQVDKTESGETTVVIGSVYGGIFFDLENGKVTRIFVGAGAE